MIRLVNHGDATSINKKWKAMNFKGKTILFISPSFFGYEKYIAERMEELGAKVFFFDDRPSNSFWGKGLLRAHKKLYAAKIWMYYRPIEKKIEAIPYIDIIFLLSPEGFPLPLLEKTIAANPNVKVLLYMWDSVQNKIGTKKYLPYCHRIFTFDPNDRKYDKRIEFCSLFYLNEYSSLNSDNYDYELSFIGTAHSDRYLLASKLKGQVEKTGGRIFYYFYLQSRKLFVYYKLTNPHFRKTKANDFQYRSLSKEETMKIIEKSKIVLDIQHPKQTGLTMRTLEVLGSKRKLITTNKEVSKYDFYNSNNILIVDRDAPVIPDDFLRTPYLQIDDNIYKRYSLDGWLNKIFDKL